MSFNGHHCTDFLNFSTSGQFVQILLTRQLLSRDTYSHPDGRRGRSKPTLDHFFADCRWTVPGSNNFQNGKKC